MSIPVPTGVPSAMRRSLFALLALPLVLVGCGGGGDFETTGKRLVVIGIDGMDPKLTRQFIDAGLMPNFKSLAEEGVLRSLGTSNPPQSPVAWSDFITGVNPGGHGVYDFLLLDPEKMRVVSSTQTEVEPSDIGIPLTNYQFPSPFADSPEKIQQGTPFWERLEEAGVRADVYRIPAAFPLTEGTRQMVLSDMGTPDLMGGMDGTYSFFAERLRDGLGSNDWVTFVSADDGVVRATLEGPPQPFLRPEDEHSAPPAAETPFEVHLHPEGGSAYVSIDGADGITIREGEWSEWTEIYFDLGLGQSVNAAVHFYLRSCDPFELYVSPFNIDPLAPAQPISLPDDDAIVDLAENIGRFYTMGLAEETKALQEKVLDDEDFIKQCDFITEERLRMLDYALDNFDDGLLFFYFSSIDLRCHMMYRHITPGHPAADPEGSVDVETARKRQQAIRDAYVHMDQALGHLRKRLKEKFGDEVHVMVMSDHGFAPFTRKLNLNKWLLDEGYLFLAESEDEDAPPAIDWERTRAVAMGFNSVYVNRWNGFDLSDAEAAALATELRDKLLTLEDPERDGARPVRRAFLRDEIYSGSEIGSAPDLVVGYDKHYGATDATALGSPPKESTSLFEDNESYWSGNHLMDPEVVPGTLCTNLPVSKEDPNLRDLHATLLDYFDIAVPDEVEGQPLD